MIQEEFFICRPDELVWARLEALEDVCHTGIGWIWDGTSLRCKDSAKQAKIDEHGASHYGLFQEEIYRVKVRGWFNPEKKTCTLQSREHIEPDTMGERLYRALVSRFGKDIRFVIP